mmetsp:Transcript_98146/g.277584  ORF Transcript_98146/g.277584 Transcript_98146/m.277584 type:complete len:269 (-) Transcript_98146:1156-1962(-)
MHAGSPTRYKLSDGNCSAPEYFTVNLPPPFQGPVLGAGLAPPATGGGGGGGSAALPGGGTSTPRGPLAAAAAVSSCRKTTCPFKDAIAVAASSSEANCTRAAADVSHPELGKILDRCTVRPSCSKAWFNIVRSSPEVGKFETNKLSEGNCSAPAYFTVNGLPRGVSTLATAAAKETSGELKGCSGACTCDPFSWSMAAAACSCDSSCTIAAPFPVPRVSGMILDRTTMKPKLEKVSFNVAWSMEPGRPAMYKLSDGVVPSPAYFTFRT